MNKICRLTTKDFAILETMLEHRRALDDPLAPLLEKKLANASVVLIDSIDADVVTINSRVTFRIGANPAETRTVIQNEVRGVVGASLPVTTPWGLSLLGMAEGESGLCERGGGTETIRVVKVLFQPEAARRASIARQVRPALRLVYSANSIVPPLGAVEKIRQTGADDDPGGPTAA
ncbi:nucleoside-diphosphate kinase [Mesorhizobium loti]|nr:nucleoside-diphosphate kinase [Mesorhizobium loti]PLP60127.1 nucleoside-diphosphate kinase [Mesorhizobium loti]